MADAYDSLTVETDAGRMTVNEALRRDDPEGSVNITLSAHLFVEFMEHGAARFVAAEQERRRRG